MFPLISALFSHRFSQFSKAFFWDLFKFSFLNNNGARHSRGVTSNISVEVSGGSAAAPVVVEVDVRVLQ
jgi:hypothetical protein